MTDRELSERVRKIRDLERERGKAAARECDLIVEMGKLLLDTKKRMRGGWKEWAGKSLPFSYATAARYMGVAQKVATLRLFFAQGKSVVYELLEVDDALLARLTPETVVTVKGEKKKLRDIDDCHEMEAALASLSGEKPKGPSDLTRGLGHVAGLAGIKEGNPAAWAELIDDVARLMEVARPKPPRAGTTRDERMDVVNGHIREGFPLVDAVDDVPGRLSPFKKAEGMNLWLDYWRALNMLPAYATVAPRDERKPGDAPRREGTIR